MNLKNSNLVRKAVYLWRNWRKKHSYMAGRGNRIVNNGVRVGSRIQIDGDGNKIILEKGCMLLNTLIKIEGNNNTVILKARSYVSGAELWVEDNKCTLSVGERTFVGHHTHLACTEDESQLIVGDDCMLSSYVQVRTGDSHAILDLDENRINPAQSVFIGNHCWLGEGSKVLKGVTLKGDNIVSTGAIVTSSFERNLLLGGIPAKVLKEKVTWNKNRK